MDSILIDSGYWYALYDTKDQYHSKANKIADYLSIGNIVLPFPTLYETLNSKFSKNKEWLSRFKDLISNPNVILFPDSDYKDEALRLTLVSVRNLSLVDTVLRLMLDDRSINIKYLITFNVGDFIDVCATRNISIINE